MKHFAFALAVLAGLGLSGCFTRTIVRVEEHGRAKNAMLIETADHHNWLVYQKTARTYWECSDDGKKVTCKRACDEAGIFVSSTGTDLVCPTAVGNMNNFSSGGR